MSSSAATPQPGPDRCATRVLALHAARAARYVAGVVLLAAAYYAAAKLGLRLAYLDGAVTALWPPVGVGIAALVLFGPRLWPGVVVGDLLVADYSTPLGTVLGQTMGNTLEVARRGRCCCAGWWAPRRTHRVCRSSRWSPARPWGR